MFWRSPDTNERLYYSMEAQSLPPLSPPRSLELRFKNGRAKKGERKKENCSGGFSPPPSSPSAVGGRIEQPARLGKSRKGIRALPPGRGWRKHRNKRKEDVDGHTIRLRVQNIP